MEPNYTFSGGYVLRGEVLWQAKTSILRALKQTLPYEAQRADIVLFILEQTADFAKTRRLEL